MNIINHSIKSKRVCFKYTPFPFLIFIFFPSHAFANVPIPSLFGVGAPFFLSLRSIGVIFMAIVLMEAGFLRLGLGIEWKKCIMATLIANLVSSFIGLLISSSPIFILLLLILPVFLISFFIRKKKMSLSVAVVLGLAPSICIFAWIALTWPEGRGIKTWCLYGSLLPAFLLSTIIEYPILAGLLNAKLILKWTFISNAVSYMMLAALMVILSYTPKDNPVLTYDYLYISSESLARAGNVKESLKLLQMMRNFREDYDPFYLTRELKTAKILAQKGFSKEARLILENVKNTEREKSSWDDMIEKDIKEIEKMLSD